MASRASVEGTWPRRIDQEGTPSSRGAPDIISAASRRVAFAAPATCGDSMSTQLQTTIAGSLPKPSWLAPPNQLWAPWLLEGERLAEGKRDAVRLAVHDQEQAGVDIVTDGEQTRRHFVTTFIE